MVLGSSIGGVIADDGAKVFCLCTDKVSMSARPTQGGQVMEKQFNHILEDLLARGLGSMADRFRKMYEAPKFPFLDDRERKIFLNEMVQGTTEV